MSKKIKLFFLIFFYSIEILRVIFTPITYDEYSFLIKISSQITINYGWLNNLLEIENYAGFGQFFWILYYLYNSIFVIIFNNHQLNFEKYSSVDATSFFQYIDYFGSTHIALIIFRFFCLIPFLVFFWKFVDFIENVQTNSKLNKFYNLLIITLFIVSPINWWIGKIAAPDYAAAGFVGLGLLHFLHKNYLKSTLFTAIAFSIKMNTFPFLFIFIILNLFNYSQISKINFRSKIMKLTKILFFQSMITIIVFCILNPMVIFHTDKFLSNIPVNRISIFSLTSILSNLKNFYFNSFYSWDNILIGGLSYYLGSIFLIYVLIIVAFRNNNLTLFVLLFSFFNIISISTSFNNYPWFYFPLILFLFILLIDRNQKPINQFQFIIIFIILFISIVSSSNNSLIQVKSILNWYRDYHDLSNSKCLSKGTNLRFLDLSIFGAPTLIKGNSYMTNVDQLNSLIQNNNPHINLILGRNTFDIISNKLYEKNYSIKKLQPVCHGINAYHFVRGST